MGDEGEWLEVKTTQKPRKPAAEQRDKAGGKKREQRRDRDRESAKAPQKTVSAAAHAKQTVSTASVAKGVERLSVDEREPTPINNNNNHNNNQPSAAPSAWGRARQSPVLAPVNSTVAASVSVERDTQAQSLSNFEFCARCHAYLSASSAAACPAARESVCRGLANSGNACFRNCVLQSLFAVRPFRRMTASLLGGLSAQTAFPSSLSIWSEFLSLSRKLLDDGSAEVISPDEFVPSIIKGFEQSVAAEGESEGKEGAQQDAMEFLTFLLDGLHEEVIAAEKALSVDEQRLLKPGQHREIDAASGEAEDDGWSTVSKTKTVVDERSKNSGKEALVATPISRLFHGLLSCRVNYRSKNMNSVTFQRFHCITLNVAAPSHHRKAESGRAKPVTINEALANFFAEEVMNEGKVKKQMTLDVLPEVLVLHIARFSFDYTNNVPIKIHVPVEYPEQLDIPSSFVTQGVSVALPRYRLSAAVLHHGRRATGGHYTANVKYDQWYDVNDTRVSWIPEQQALQAHELVYLLFYEKINIS